MYKGKRKGLKKFSAHFPHYALLCYNEKRKRYYWRLLYNAATSLADRALLYNRN